MPWFQRPSPCPGFVYTTSSSTIPRPTRELRRQAPHGLKRSQLTLSLTGILVLQGYDFSLVRSKLHTGYTSRKVKNNTPSSRPSTIYLPPFLLGVARSSRRLFDSPSHVAVGLRVRSPGGIPKCPELNQPQLPTWRPARNNCGPMPARLAVGGTVGRLTFFLVKSAAARAARSLAHTHTLTHTHTHTHTQLEEGGALGRGGSIPLKCSLFIGRVGGIGRERRGSGYAG